MKNGIDIDTTQWFNARTWNFWQNVKNLGYDFAYVKVTKGKDVHIQAYAPKLELQLGIALDYGRQAYAARLEMGAGHIFDPKVAGNEQASFFAKCLTKKVRSDNTLDVLSGKLLDFYQQRPALFLTEPGDPKDIKRGVVLFLETWANFKGLAAPYLVMSSTVATNMGLSEIEGIEHYPLWLVDHSAHTKEDVIIPEPWFSKQKNRVFIWEKASQVGIASADVGVNEAIDKAIPTKTSGGIRVPISPTFIGGAIALGAGYYMVKKAKLGDRAGHIYKAFT